MKRIEKRIKAEAKSWVKDLGQFHGPYKTFADVEAKAAAWTAFSAVITVINKRIEWYESLKEQGVHPERVTSALAALEELKLCVEDEFEM